MKKGFTLIELLAVIVILAIIALIATPMVLSIIEDSKSNANLRSAENYLTAAKQSITNHQMNNPDQSVSGVYKVMKNGNLCKGTIENDKCNGIEIKVQVSGEKIMPRSITIGDTGDLTNVEGLEINGKNYAYTNGGLKENPIKTVYRWSKDSISIGDIMDDSSKYTTDPSKLGKYVYLKHVLDKNKKVIESYTCIMYNIMSDEKEVCVRGGKDENGNTFYGYAENKSDYTGNMLILKTLSDEGFNCDLSIGSSNCSMNLLNLYAGPGGIASGSSGDGDRCGVLGDGSSSCTSS